MAPVTPALQINVGRLLPVQSQHGLQSELPSKNMTLKQGLKVVQYLPVPSSCLCARTCCDVSTDISTRPFTADFAGQSCQLFSPGPGCFLLGITAH